MKSRGWLVGWLAHFETDLWVANDQLVFLSFVSVVNLSVGRYADETADEDWHGGRVLNCRRPSCSTHHWPVAAPCQWAYLPHWVPATKGPNEGWRKSTIDCWYQHTHTHRNIMQLFFRIICISA